MQKLIKICGVQDAETAEYAAQMGANYIGMICYESSKRHVNINQAKQIAKASKTAGAIPVLVFVDAKAEKIQNLCRETDVHVVQLHGEISKKQYAKLAKEISKIWVCNVTPEGTWSEEDIKVELDEKHDFLLFDNLIPGSGKTFNWNNFSYQENFRWFLSGGLSVNNIKAAIEQLNPTGVDASSGLENSGKKDKTLIKQFIQRANHE